MRYKRCQSALQRVGCGAADKRILIRIPADHSPSTRQVAVDAELEALGALAACLNGNRGIVRIARSCVRSVETIHGRGEGQIAGEVPLRSDLVIRELLRL